MSASWQPDDLGAAAEPVGRLGAHALSSGNVTVRVGGVRDAAHLDGLLRAMRAIRGVGGVRLRATEPVRSPVVVLNATRPIALASELRSELGRQVTSCVFVDGEIRLELDGTAPDPSPRRRRGADQRPGDGPPRARPRASHHRPPPGLGTRPAPNTGASDGVPRPAPGSWPDAEERGTGTATPPGAPITPPGESSARPAPAPGPDAGAGAGAAADAGAPGRGPADDDALRRAIDDIGSLSVLTFDTGLRFVRTAGAMHERYDHATQDLLGRRPDEIVDAATWETLRPGYEGALVGRTTTVDTPSPDGRRRYRATFRPLVEGRRIVGGSVALVDVTDVRREERRLEELRDVFASSFDGSPVGQALLSPDGRWMRVNPALERLLDLEAGALVGHAVHDVVLPREREREAELLESVRTGERDGFDLDTQVVRGGGDVVGVRLRVTAIRTREATLRGFFAHLAPTRTWADPAD